MYTNVVWHILYAATFLNARCQVCCQTALAHQAVLVTLHPCAMSQARWSQHCAAWPRPQGGGSVPSSGQDHEPFHSWQSAQSLQGHPQPAELGADTVPDRP